MTGCCKRSKSERRAPLRRAPLRLGWLAAVLAAFLVLSIGPALAEKRIALVIGNAGYSSLQPLSNTLNDAEDISTTLRSLGFEVREAGTDLGRPEMEAAIERLAAESASADVSLFYYAGHGLQIAGRNFLIPVDAELASEAEVPRLGLDLDWIIRKLNTGPGMKVIILDACRNNPLPRSLADGLAPVALPPGFLVAYSAESNGVAFDGSGRNGPFAKALLSHLSTPGEDILSVLVSVRKDVVAMTGGKQIPADWSSLTRQVVLAPGEPLPYPPDTMLWQLAARGPDRDLLTVYLDRYPDGAHAEDARVQLASLEQDPGSVTRSLGSESREVGELLWTLGRNGRNRPLVELYLTRYPDGSHVAEARQLLATLAASEASDQSPDLLCDRLATHPNDSTAGIRGVPLAELRRKRDPAVTACRAAVTAFPENPHYVALLARAVAAGRQQGQPIPAEAIDLYRQAAERGDARAMQTLARLMQTGDSVTKDLPQAMALYERAAQRGNADAAVNLAVALYSGVEIDVDIPRAVQLLRSASDAGSGMATYNLAVLYDGGVIGTSAEALDLFLRAAEQGETRAYVAAAKLLDEGRGVERDPAAAAGSLLSGIITDPGDAMNEIMSRTDTWSSETIRAIQTRLQQAGYYDGAIDAKSGPKLAAALVQWRLLGPRGEKQPG